MKFDEQWSRGWFDMMAQKLTADPVKAKAMLMALVGSFTLSPETIGGIRYLRVKGNGDIRGLLEAADSRNERRLSTYWGADFPVIGASSFCS